MATQMNPAALAGLSGVARRLVVEGTLADADFEAREGPRRRGSFTFGVVFVLGERKRRREAAEDE